MSSLSPVISDVMIKIPLAVALYTLATSGWHSLPYNVVFFCYMFVIIETNQQSMNESLVRLSWIKWKTNKCYTVGLMPKSNIKHDSWLSANMGGT